MTQQQLNGAQVRARIQQVRGKGMSQHVRTETLLDSSFLAELLTDLPNGGLMDWEPWLVAGEQPVCWLPPAPINAQ